MIGHLNLQSLLQRALDIADQLTLQSLHQAHIYHDKGERDFALDVDVQVEQAVKQCLATSGIAVLGEELAWQGEDNPEQFWVVDPIDGTINYAHGLPLFGTCIALVENGQAVLAGITLPGLHERYWAVAGQGAYLNGRRLQVSKVNALSQALLGMGDFAVGVGCEVKNQQRFAILQTFAPQVLRVRMLGSAAIQLAWLAAGRLDMSLILSNKAWDVQAGVLLVREAGGCVFDVDGSEHNVSSRYTLAAVPELKAALSAVLTNLFSVQIHNGATQHRFADERCKK